MAKAQQVKIVRIRSASPRKGTLVRRGAAVAARAAASEKHRLGALAGAAAVGLAERYRIGLPTIPVLGMAGTYGVVAYAAARFTKSRMLDHAATGLLAVAVHQLAKAGISSSAGVEGDLVID